jgi:transcriptional regulator with XRE-family HTH domain
MAGSKRPKSPEKGGKLQNHADAPGWAEALRQRRKALGLTQRQVAELAGVAERTVIAAERGHPGMRLELLLGVLGVLGLRLRLERGRGSIEVGDVGD